MGRTENRHTQGKTAPSIPNIIIGHSRGRDMSGVHSRDMSGAHRRDISGELNCIPEEPQVQSNQKCLVALYSHVTLVRFCNIF